MTKEEFISAVNLYRPAVFNYCKSRLNHWQDAEDMTNNVFYKIWRRRNSIKMETIKTVMKVITRNTCIDYFRRRCIMPDKMPLIGYEGEYEDHVEDRMFFKEVEKVIDGLPPQQKRLIKMKYFEGIGPGEISEMLGLSDSSIRNQLCTGLKNIRKRIEKEKL